MNRDAMQPVSGAEVQQVLERLVQQAPSAFDVDAADRAAVEAKAGAQASTYGEVLPAGIAPLANALGVQRDCVFADLGSGSGLVVFGMALLHPLAASVGIELSRARHAAAQASLAQLKQDAPTVLLPRLESVRLLQGDLLDCDWHGCTHAFVAATCFPPALLHALLTKARSTPTLRRIALTVPLPDAWRPAFSSVGHLPLPMTFSPRVKVHLYEPR